MNKEAIALLFAIATTARPLAAIMPAPEPVSDKLASAAPPISGQAIPWPQIGAKAGADYRGDGLSITPTHDGARLRCVFQRLEGEVTPTGLWLVSTVTNTAQERFRVVAASLGRVPVALRCGPHSSRAAGGTESPLPEPSRVPGGVTGANLPMSGTVEVCEQVARLIRPGVIEEYIVSLDGVRQDFIVTEKPACAGDLRVCLEVPFPLLG